MTTPIFVFGSNLAGRHGKGAAKWAVDNRKAEYGRPLGIQGDAYAIPTKGFELETLPLWEIRQYVNHFLEYARTFPQKQFELTPIGCGLAGLSPADIAPMFSDAPSNVALPGVFKAVLASRDESGPKRTGT